MPSGTHVPAASAPVGKETLDSFAGLYRSVRDRTVISIEVRAGHLEIDGRALRFVSDNLFREGATGPLVRFDTDTGGNASRLRMVSEADPDNYYERVERATPSSADLAGMVGEYRSDEAEVTLKVTLEPNGLVIHRRPATTILLTPTYMDGFSSSLGSVRFIRDSSGRVKEMSVGESRVWDLRLRRVQ